MPYREKYITLERYLGEYKGHGNMYIGFVIGYGYCDTTAFAIQPPHMNGYSPSCGRLYGNDSHYVTGRQQIEDTSIEAKKLSLRGLFNNGEAVVTVKAGMTLGQIAVLFDVTVAELAKWNNLENPDKIQVGQQIKIYKSIKNQQQDNVNIMQLKSEETNGYTFVDFAGGVLTAEDLYNIFFHNHTTYKTTKNATKLIYKPNGAVRSARAAGFAKTSKLVKGAGVAGTVFMTSVAGYSIYDDLNSNRSVKLKDVADLSVGTVGLATSGLVVLGIVSNPVGWVVGAGVVIYSIGSTAYDLYSTDW